MCAAKIAVARHAGLFVFAFILVFVLSTVAVLAQPGAGNPESTARDDAVTVQVGTEEINQVGSFCHVPFDMYYNHSVAEIVYPASLFVDSDDAAVDSGTIKSIAFYSANPNKTTCASLSIYLGYTSEADASSRITPSDCALVYQGNNVDINIDTGWQAFEFNQGGGTFPFDSSKGNLVAIILRTGSYNTGAGWWVSEAANASRYYRSDSVSYTDLAEGINATNDIHNYRPNTQFSIIPAPGPKFTSQPEGFTYQAGTENGEALAAVAESADASIGYQWYRSDSAGLKVDDLGTATTVGGQGTATVTDGLATITCMPSAADLGTVAGVTYYYCAATDSNGTRLSKAAAVYVFTSEAQAPLGVPAVESEPAAVDGAVAANAGAPFVLRATGATAAQAGDALHYQWFVKADGADGFAAVEGATEATYTAKAELDKTNVYRYEVWASHEVPTNVSARVTSSELAVTGKPIMLGSESELRELATNVNAGYSYEGVTIALANDIELTSAWTSIGTADNPFKGTFDGREYIISGLSVESAGNNQGLFGYVAGATIKNLVVQGSGVSAASYVAGVVGRAEGATRIQNVGNETPVTSTGGYTGGIVGGASAAVQIVACYNKAPITTSSTNARTGGIIGNGSGDASVTSCYNTGAVTCIASSNMWGIGGISGVGTVLKNNINTGRVTEPGSYHGAINGEGGTAGTDGDINYYLAGSSDKVSSSSGRVAIELTAGQLAGTENYNGAVLLDALNSGAYDGVWIGGDDQGSPKLFWEAADGMPAITTHPASAEYAAGEAIAVLVCEAEYPAGTGRDEGLTYEWFDVSDRETVLATGKTFAPTVADASSAVFVCVVTNPNGDEPVSTTSKAATIKVLGDYAAEPPAFAAPAEATAIDGKPFTTVPLEVDVSVSKGDLTYQWFTCEDAQGANPQAVDGKTSTTYKFKTGVEGVYHFFCRATNTDAFARAGEQSATADSPVFTVEIGDYTISTPAELKAFQQSVDLSQTFAGTTVYLKADLDLQSDPETKEWDPIDFFAGTFDGEGHTIDGLIINADEPVAGLFSTLRGNAVIKDVVIGANSSVKGPYQVGGIAGNAMASTAQIINCGNNATVQASRVFTFDNSSYAGGIIGYTTGEVSVTACYNTGDISGKANGVGGVVGGTSSYESDRYKTVITSCYNAGTVTNEKANCATGGIAGWYTKIVNCLNVGEVPGGAAANDNSIGAIGGLCPKEVSATSDDVSYYLDTSCANPVGCNETSTGDTGHEAAYYIPKSAAELSAAAMVGLLNVGDYAGTWGAGSDLDTPRDHPVLFWEVAPVLKARAAADLADAEAAVQEAEAKAKAAEQAAAEADAAVAKAEQSGTVADAEAAQAAAAAAQAAAAEAREAVAAAVEAADKAKASNEAIGDTEGATAAQNAVEKAAAAKTKADTAAGAADDAAVNADNAKAAADKEQAAKEQAAKEQAEKDRIAKEQAAKEKAAREKAMKKVKSVTVNAKTVTAKAVAKAIKKAGGSTKYVTKITLGKKCKTVNAKAFSKCTALKTLVVGKNVKKLKGKAFSGCKKLKTVTVKTKKLAKKAVKGCFKGCKAKRVKLKAPKAKKKAYKKVFTKKNCGKKLKIS